jgi:peptidyl-prolyl cis-trans isomerase A (cyclophilin A)
MQPLAIRPRINAALATLATLAGIGFLAACGSGERKAASGPPPDVGLPGASSSEAPANFRVRFETSKGAFVLEAHRAWSPRGADRLYQLVQSGFFDNTRFFRALTGFMVQFGIHGEPAVNAAWERLPIPDDSVAHSNARGTMSFATSGPATRTTQVFINLVDNASLDAMGFSPVGAVIEGMAVVDSLYAGYGEGAPSGFGPDQMRIMSEGNAYLEREFPKLDFIRTARLVEAAGGDSAAATSVSPAAEVVPPKLPASVAPARPGKARVY